MEYVKATFYYSYHCRKFTSEFFPSKNLNAFHIQQKRLFDPYEEELINIITWHFDYFVNLGLITQEYRPNQNIQHNKNSIVYYTQCLSYLYKLADNKYTRSVLKVDNFSHQMLRSLAEKADILSCKPLTAYKDYNCLEASAVNECNEYTILKDLSSIIAAENFSFEESQSFWITRILEKQVFKYPIARSLACLNKKATEDIFLYIQAALSNYNFKNLINLTDPSYYLYNEYELCFFRYFTSNINYSILPLLSFLGILFDKSLLILKQILAKYEEQNSAKGAVFSRMLYKQIKLGLFHDSKFLFKQFGMLNDHEAIALFNSGINSIEKLCRTNKTKVKQILDLVSSEGNSNTEKVESLFNICKQIPRLLQIKHKITSKKVFPNFESCDGIKVIDDTYYTNSNCNALDSNKNINSEKIELKIICRFLCSNIYSISDKFLKYHLYICTSQDNIIFRDKNFKICEDVNIEKVYKYDKNKAIGELEYYISNANAQNKEYDSSDAEKQEEAIIKFDFITAIDPSDFPIKIFLLCDDYLSLDKTYLIANEADLVGKVYDYVEFYDTQQEFLLQEKIKCESEMKLYEQRMDSYYCINQELSNQIV